MPRPVAIGIAQARDLMSRPTTLVVDVRTPGEFTGGHIPGAVNIPSDEVAPNLRRIVTAAGGTLLLVCQSGGRAEKAADQLGSGGLSDFAVLSGGMNSWVSQGGEVHYPSVDHRWSLERQIRLVAGSIVLASILASTIVPGLRWIAGLVGAGLVIAALTNTCLMGALLATLPYNTRGPSCDIDAAIERLRLPDAETA